MYHIIVLSSIAAFILLGDQLVRYEYALIKYA